MSLGGESSIQSLGRRTCFRADALVKVVEVLALDTSGEGETVEELRRTHALQKRVPISSGSGASKERKRRRTMTLIWAAPIF